VLVALLAVAGVVAHTAPGDAEWQAPITVLGAIGDETSGRNITATVTGVRLADEVVAANGWSGSTEGVWVVVDASVAAAVSDYGALLRAARLQIGDTLYSASSRPDLGTIAGQSLTTGIPLTGPLMFEVPRDILQTDAAADAEVQLGLDADVRVDSLIVVPVDLGSLPVEESIETERPEWGAR
jgi:hypothetical protein